MKSKFLENDNLYLREVRPADVNESYYRWMNDPEVTRYLESRFFPVSTEELSNYVTSKQGDRSNIFLAIVLKEKDRHIGNIKIGPIDWIHRHAEIGLMIGEKDCWGKGYASEAITLILQYSFNVLNLHKLMAGCYESNKGSVRAFEKVGFEIEGIRKQHFFSNGKYEDAILMGVLNPRLKM